MNIQVHSYANPTSRCAGPDCGCSNNQRTVADTSCRCCDHSSTMDSTSVCEGMYRCDNLFTYCLMQMAAVSLSNVCTDVSNKAQTNTTNWNDRPINFSRSSVLGLSNGFTIPGLDTAWMVMTLSTNPQFWGLTPIN